MNAALSKSKRRAPSVGSARFQHLQYLQYHHATKRRWCHRADRIGKERRAKRLAHLRPIEADILRQRFGFDNDEELTLKEIGEKYKLSRERIRQLQEQALDKMRKALQRKDLM